MSLGCATKTTHTHTHVDLLIMLWFLVVATLFRSSDERLAHDVIPFSHVSSVLRLRLLSQGESSTHNIVCKSIELHASRPDFRCSLWCHLENRSIRRHQVNRRNTKTSNTTATDLYVFCFYFLLGRTGDRTAVHGEPKTIPATEYSHRVQLCPSHFQRMAVLRGKSIQIQLLLRTSSIYHRISINHRILPCICIVFINCENFLGSPHNFCSDPAIWRSFVCVCVCDFFKCFVFLPFHLPQNP